MTERFEWLIILGHTSSCQRSCVLLEQQISLCPGLNSKEAPTAGAPDSDRMNGLSNPWFSAWSNISSHSFICVMTQHGWWGSLLLSCIEEPTAVVLKQLPRNPCVPLLWKMPMAIAPMLLKIARTSGPGLKMSVQRQVPARTSRAVEPAIGFKVWARFCHPKEHRKPAALKLPKTFASKCGLNITLFSTN